MQKVTGLQQDSVEDCTEAVTQPLFHMDDVALQAYTEGGGAGCQLFLHSGLWTNTVLD